MKLNIVLYHAVSELQLKVWSRLLLGIMFNESQVIETMHVL